MTLAERWNGTRWIIQKTPNPAGGTQVALNGVSCAGDNCTAVGSYTSRTGRLTALAERRRNGRWSIAPAGFTGWRAAQLAGGRVVQLSDTLVTPSAWSASEQVTRAL